jgi:hypothetical protein
MTLAHWHPVKHTHPGWLIRLNANGLLRAKI